jgi:NTP pyrophosphatase (non-canonical NTP hydrolase)
MGMILRGDVRGRDEIQRAIKSKKNVSAIKENLADERFDFSALSRY